MKEVWRIHQVPGSLDYMEGPCERRRKRKERWKEKKEGRESLESCVNPKVEKSTLTRFQAAGLIRADPTPPSYNNSPTSLLGEVAQTFSVTISTQIQQLISMAILQNWVAS